MVRKQRPEDKVTAGDQRTQNGKPQADAFKLFPKYLFLFHLSNSLCSTMQETICNELLPNREMTLAHRGGGLIKDVTSAF